MFVICKNSCVLIKNKFSILTAKAACLLSTISKVQEKCRLIKKDRRKFKRFYLHTSVLCIRIFHFNINEVILTKFKRDLTNNKPKFILNSAYWILDEQLIVSSCISFYIFLFNLT